jgi:putative DNA primase/helicase
MSLMDAMSRFRNPNIEGFTPLIPVPLSERLVLSENESMTDYGNAQRFIHQNGKNVCYVGGMWYLWDGRMWRPDTTNQIEVFAQNTARSIFNEAQQVAEAKYRSDLQKWGRASLNHARYTKMLKSASTYLPVSLDLFDTHKYLLGVENGTIDLKTGELFASRRDDRITKLCNVKHDTDARSELWLSFLDRIFDGNADLIRYVQKMVGYCLTGIVSEKCFFILLGPRGDNGKSVFMNVVMWLMGDYAIDMPIDSLLQRKPGASSNDLVRLKGSRLVSCSEANRQYYFDEALVKRLTGSDPITARALYKEYVTFRPEGKILIATNKIPKFDTTDTAFDNRVRMIPFDVTIPKEEQDPNLYDKLMDESSGILTWAVEGCLLWHQEGLGDVPVSIQTDTANFRRSSLDDFIRTSCDVGGDFYCKAHDLYTDYLGYHELIADGTDPISFSVFGIGLSRRGITSTHHRDGNYRVGIAPKVWREATEE